MCFPLKGGWLRGDRNDLKKITGNLFLRLLLFVSSSHVLPSIQKNSITFQAGLDLHLHRQACLNTSSRTRSNFKLTWVTCFLIFSACLDDDSSGFVLFLVCFVSSESSATIHASRISGFLVFTAVPLSLCHVKATLYTVNR